MIEIPEATTLAAQVQSRLLGREIETITAGHSPHKFAWYYGDPDKYQPLASGHTITGAEPVGGMLQIEADGILMLFSEGAALRYLEPGSARPKKHQFLLEFTDRSVLCAGVQMYGGIGVFRPGECENEYYDIAVEKPVVLSDAFDARYFANLIGAENTAKLSAKAFLATEQRIPGLGNGVLQDILYHAGVHPKTRVGSMDDADLSRLFDSLKTTLGNMVAGGGRDTETDLFGNPGGYATRASRNTVGSPCPKCGDTITKAPYMGGSVYFCPGCQPLKPL